MGVPAFFRWISEKYPKIIAELIEEKIKYIDGHPFPPDLTQEIPNGITFDNLYIDMNGIIHPCSHPEDRSAPQSEQEMYENVTEYVDRLFAAIRPRKLLFLAIDGVAPRAKMNQQRSRRFRAAQDAKQRAEMMNEVRQEMIDMGLHPPGHDGPEWDSNVITPGTEFMDKLSLYLEYYVLERMNSNPAWQQITVILSDASEPGEGEHKIMAFIRRQRTLPDYDPNQWHVLHGLDADLIMLALATHEMRFTILREEVLFGRQQRDRQQQNEAKAMIEAQLHDLPPEKVEVGAERATDSNSWVYNKPLQMLHTHILREYLEAEFAPLAEPGALPFQFNLERIIDDFVFMCFFVGNDFLPHLPSLDIRDGAIDFLIETYKQVLPALKGYLTHGAGDVNLSNVDVLLAKVGEIEDIVFRMRRDSEMQQQRRREQQQQQNGNMQRRDFAREGNALLQHARESNSLVSIVENRDNRTAQFSSARHTRFDGSGNVTTNHLDVMKQRLLETLDAKQAMDGSSSNQRAVNSDAAAKLRERLQGTNDDQQPEMETDKTLGKRIHAETIESAGDGQVVGNDEQPLKKSSKAADELDADGETTMEVAASSPLPLKSVTMETEIEAVVDETVEMTGAEEGKQPDTNEDADAEAPQAPELSADETAQELKDRMKAKQNALIDKYRTEINDNIRLHEDGWKERYYQDDFKRKNIEEGGGKERMIQTYVEGLCWVFKYYYDGCPSWKWYYPFHYAPFASDLVNIDRLDIDFEESEPFRPIEQLLAVLPPASANALPEACRPLMLDPNSPIADFYPTEVVLDPNGKALPWLWIALLPFIDEGRLKDAMASVEAGFTEDDRCRNNFGVTHIFIHSRHPIQQSAILESVQTQANDDDGEQTSDSSLPHVQIACADGTGYGGDVRPVSQRFRVRVGGPVTAPSTVIPNNQVYVYDYTLPRYSRHNPNQLANVDMPATVLTPLDRASRHLPRLNRGRHILDVANDHQRMSAGQSRYAQGVSASQRMIVQGVQGGGGAYYDQYQRTSYQQSRDSRSYEHSRPHDNYRNDYRSDNRSDYRSDYRNDNRSGSYNYQQPSYQQSYNNSAYSQSYPAQRGPPPSQAAPPRNYEYRRGPPPPTQGYSFQAPQSSQYPQQQQPPPPQAAAAAGGLPNIASLTAQLAATLRRDQNAASAPDPRASYHAGNYGDRQPRNAPRYPPGGAPPAGRGRDPRARDNRQYNDNYQRRQYY